ncbi:MAG TPA: glycoside hydrolase family 18 protein [Symbiobacteriaceae bacterium]|nr:glycoside hydrolase family 18 protein [Symbiobacteriaceae bacterium]
MQIHVVQPGESVYTIARRYQVSPESIAQVNELEGQPHLVVGQALVIPVVGQIYTVRPGKSLYTIGRRFGVPAAELARVNQIPLEAPIQAGLRLYIPPGARRRAEINAYVEPTGDGYSEAALADVRRALPQLTYLAPFSFRVRRDGTLQAPALDDLRRLAESADVTPMMVVTNIEGDRFSSELGRIILNDQEVQTRLLDNILQTARRLGFHDIHFDLEFLRPEDREAYNRFLRRAADRIHGEGLMISTALAPKTSAAQRGAWYEAHDYRAHGQIVDFVVPMTYEWGYSGGPPMAVSPIGPVRQVLEYAVSEIPPGKILMGQNLYGYDWRLPYVRGGEFARALSPQAAIRLAAQRNVAIEYDTTAQAPYFDYVDEQGRNHRVWFEDARSIQAKIDLVKELGLRGISYWRLGLPFPQNWQQIEANFDVAKR